jgi:hypothetical protein
MIDILLLAIVGGVAFMVSNDGAWSAGATFVCVLVAGLLAMNFFEPLAVWLTAMSPAWGHRWDVVALVGLFTVLVFGLRTISERLAPTYIQVDGWVDQAGRWAFGAATGYVTMAFLLTALHTAPLPREFLGFTPERANLGGMLAPDRQWLGFVQYVTEKSFARYDRNIGFDADNKALPHAFDGSYLALGDGANPYPNTIWPSFPMRYAMRREMLSGGAAPVVPMTPVRPAPGPSGPSPGAVGGGGGGGGGAAPTF